jgi:hypothetical protein
MSRPLYQALLGIDHNTFELLITQLLKARYPNAAIHHVDGKSGDTGLDIICGQLDERPTIWQCKHFTNGIKESQKQQIRDSLNNALQHHHPHRWVLCIPIDLDAPTHRWFQKLIKSREQETIVSLYDAGAIAQELLYRHTIRETYFPATIINVPVLREHLTGTNAFTTPELAALTDQNAQSYLARLEALDARFDYDITIGRNRKPTATPDGALLTINTGGNTVRVFPRDLEALKANPLGATIKLQGTGPEKFFDHLRTGKPQEFTPEEIVSITSDFDHLLPTERDGATLHVSQRPNETIPLRIIFGEGAQAITYEYLQFTCTRAGTEEAQFVNKTPLPFHLTFTLRRGGGTVNFADNTTGQQLEPTLQLVRAIIAALTTGSITLYNLEKNLTLPRFRVHSPVPRGITFLEKLLNALQKISKAYGVPLTVPHTVGKRDGQTLELLEKLLDGVDLPTAEITAELQKTTDDETALRRILAEPCSLRIEKPELPEELVLFGHKVPTGPIRYSISNARVKDPSAVTHFLDSAPLGAIHEVIFVTESPIRLKRIPVMEL